MQIGFIGLGIMGLPMAKHLIDAGNPLVVWSKTRSKAEALGQKVADSPADLAAKCDLIFLIVSDTQGVEAANGARPLATASDAAFVIGGVLPAVAGAAPSAPEDRPRQDERLRHERADGVQELPGRPWAVSQLTT